VVGDAALQYHHLKDLTLLNDVIREVLRLHPPLHSLMRKIVSPFPIPGTNYILPAGDFLMCAPGVSAIDPEHWDNPTDFYPERWEFRKLEEESEEKIDFGYGLVSKGGNSPYLPFGAGRHRCIGEQFATIQLETIISTFVREMRWTAGPVPQPDYTVCQYGEPGTNV
jgi:cytochrome P450